MESKTWVLRQRGLALPIKSVGGDTGSKFFTSPYALNENALLVLDYNGRLLFLNLSRACWMYWQGSDDEDGPCVDNYTEIDVPGKAIADMTVADGKVFVNSCSVGILLIAPGSGSSGGAAPPTPSTPGWCTNGGEWAARTSQSGCKWSPVPNSDPQSCVYQQKSWCQGQCEGIWCGPGVKDAGCGAGGWCQKVGSRKP